MATFNQNIAKIRGQAIYGAETRTAIADALVQAMDLDLENKIFVILTKMQGTDNDYLLEIENEEES